MRCGPQNSLFAVLSAMRWVLWPGGEQHSTGHSTHGCSATAAACSHTLPTAYPLPSTATLSYSRHYCTTRDHPSAPEPPRHCRILLCRCMRARPRLAAPPPSASAGRACWSWWWTSRTTGLCVCVFACVCGLCVCCLNAKKGSWQASSVWGPSVHGGLQWWNVCAGWCGGVWMGAGSLHR